MLPISWSCPYTRCLLLVVEIPFVLVAPVTDVGYFYVNAGRHFHVGWMFPVIPQRNALAHYFDASSNVAGVGLVQGWRKVGEVFGEVVAVKLVDYFGQHLAVFVKDGSARKPLREVRDEDLP